MLTVKTTGKRPLGRPRRRWKGSIRMDLKEIGISTRSLVDSARDKDYRRALVNAALNLRVSQVMEFFLRFLKRKDIILIYVDLYLPYNEKHS